MHQYTVHILYKNGPDLYIADWLSHHNHTESKDQEKAGMNIKIHTQHCNRCLVCRSVEDIRCAMSVDTEVQMLQTYM